MDDPDWAWPAWKFGMRRDDLFTSLHERYNTFTYSLQDPEAFHHDVYEISIDADTPEQFHRLMADRRQQRLRELNESLDTLAVEIIANPKLMASDQWQYALQLFRTKSYDSIVRYFASYLPDHYLNRHDYQSSSSCSSFSEADSVHTLSTKASSADRALFLDDDFFPDGPVVTVEPCTLDDDVHHHEACSGDAPSPSTSEAMSPESSVSSPSDADSRSFSSTNPPSRSMSFSGSESGHIVPGLTRRSFSRRGEDETYPLHDCDTADTSVYSLKEARPTFDNDAAVLLENTSQFYGSPYCEEDDEFPTAQLPDDQFGHLDALNTTNDMLESDTPTPRQEGIAAAAAACCYMDHRPVPVRKVLSRHRAPSPKLALACREPGYSTRDVRRSPEEALSRIQKPTQDALRKRPKGRRPD
ncbi:hypothetical protein HRG_006384 [Hirsutella rhossiliensis]|uniref:Uncharacterized protein n=1 Tax=Hirsutella rhossiliensis TaxID=111463 RepID=A0A9P8MVQ8_9HYPO|nr:uncharacterized protein HRG_06384 [Hirsutella rhossiliensis]KAH0962282.1 hypothetical protein HRG_06384 [Hirsutella rhossiliensis]